MVDRENKNYIAALDIGTTRIRCQIINAKAESISEASTEVQLIYPEAGYVEINPNTLWNSIIGVVTEAIFKANLTPSNIKCMGISTQRATFLTWRRDNGSPFHNFITWKDLRSKSLVKQWNASVSMLGLRGGAYLLYLISRSKRYLAGSSMILTSTQATLRLVWVLNNIPQLREECLKNNVMFGTVDTWLVYKLTGHKTYITDYTNASATGLFDPFDLKWSSWIHTLLNIPKDILPEIVDNDHDFGVTEANIFGVSIPIKCVMADQQSSLFGSCCFTPNILKVTLGTGTFLDIQTETAHASGAGIYPLVGWSINNVKSFIAEGACNDTGSLIQWALRIGLLDDPSETSAIATSVESNDGVYFVPAFSGLGPPICDDKAGSGFIGVKPTTQKAHMIRSMIESIVFRIILQYEVLKKEINTEIKTIYVDGGVSKCDFACQFLADMTGLEVERTVSSEMSIMGVAFLAGLNSGIWSSTEELKTFRKIDKVFKPTDDKCLKDNYALELKQWMNAVKSFKAWYS